MHDLVHDLALSIAIDECSVVTKQSSVAAKVCHLSILDNGQEVTTQLEKLSKVQTVIFHTNPLVSLVETCISRFKYLRMLDFEGSYSEELPSSIGTLKHLRFLKLADNDKIKRLPNSICKLHNLQTLWLAGCKNLERLPKGIRNMISLRCLIVTTTHISLLENGEGCLNSLRTLFIVDCEHLKCLFEGMDGRLPYLLRTLFIVDCEHLKCLFEGMDGRLPYLRTLIVGDCPSLTSLSLSIKHLTALEVLLIRNCEELSLTEGEDNQNLKLSLRTLKIASLPKLEVLPQWLQGSANTLQHLMIADCQNFTGLPEWLPSIKSLQKLWIGNCPKLSSLPKGMKALTALRELKIINCEELSFTEEEDNQNLKLSLRTLKIVKLPKLEVLPRWLQGSANTLQHLEIDKCHNFTTFPEWLPSLKLLQRLLIDNCPKLSSLPKGMQALTALRELKIHNCEELSLTEEEENQDLKLSLRMLDIWELPKLEVLPQWLQGSANTLQHLEIGSCDNFKTLPEWLPSLKSLQKLLIRHCPKLSLPERMQDLTALRVLKIINCPNLRTKRKQDWPQIAHVPDVDLADFEIEYLTWHRTS